MGLIELYFSGLGFCTAAIANVLQHKKYSAAPWRYIACIGGGYLLGRCVADWEKNKGDFYGRTLAQYQERFTKHQAKQSQAIQNAS